MSFSYLGFFISQIVFVPVFLITTQRLFKPDMKIREYVGYTLISPFCVYLLSMILYGVTSVFIPSNEAFNAIADYADILALAISFVFAYVYSHTARGSSKTLMFFVYISFYMVGMVFSIVYYSDFSVLIFSVLIPIATAFIMYMNFTLPLSRITAVMHEFHGEMLWLPIAAEAMLVLRFILMILSRSDTYLAKYDNHLLIYSTLFGYIVLILILACTGMITKDLEKISIIIEQKDCIEQDNIRVRKLTFDMLRALVATIEAKDIYTNGHSNRVAEYSRMIAARLGYDEEEQLHVYNIALLHDIGKIAVPDEIINSPGGLTAEQFRIVMQHPLKGAAILKDIDEIPDLALGALYHHEKWDGSGYPHGIAGEEIPYVARIISVADAYDAMTSKRSYRAAMEQSIVRAEIEKGIGTQFYPDTARIMLDIIDDDTDFKLRQIG